MSPLSMIAPLLPLIARAGLALCFLKKMRSALPEGAQLRDEHRSMILALAGFSFAGIVAIMVLDSGQQPDMEMPVYYLAASFFAFVWALCLQSVKLYRWHSQLSSGLMEAGLLSVILSIGALVQHPSPFGAVRILAWLGFVIWALDVSNRIRLDVCHLKALEDAR